MQINLFLLLLFSGGSQNGSLVESCLVASEFLFQKYGEGQSEYVLYSLDIENGFDIRFLKDAESGGFPLIRSYLEKIKEIEVDDSSLNGKRYNLRNSEGKTFVLNLLGFNEDENRKIFVFEFGVLDLKMGDAPLLLQGKSVSIVEVSNQSNCKEIFFEH